MKRLVAVALLAGILAGCGTPISASIGSPSPDASAEAQGKHRSVESYAFTRNNWGYVRLGLSTKTLITGESVNEYMVYYQDQNRQKKYLSSEVVFGEDGGLYVRDGFFTYVRKDRPANEAPEVYRIGSFTTENGGAKLSVKYGEGQSVSYRFDNVEKSSVEWTGKHHTLKIVLKRLPEPANQPKLYYWANGELLTGAYGKDVFTAFP